jgi:hypothetical protein
VVALGQTMSTRHDCGRVARRDAEHVGKVVANGGFGGELWEGNAHSYSLPQTVEDHLDKKQTVDSRRLFKHSALSTAWSVDSVSNITSTAKDPGSSQNHCRSLY